MSLLKKLAGQTAMYGLSSILGRMINFLLVPFYTDEDVLNVKEFGIMTELYADIAFLIIVYTFGMETTYFRFATKEKLSEKDSFNNSSSFLISISLFISALLILFSPALSNVYNYEGKEAFFILMASILALDTLAAIPFARLRLEEKAGKFAFIKLTNIFINVFFNIFFLVGCKNIYEGNYLTSLTPFVKSFYNPSHSVEYILLSNAIASLITLILLAGKYKGFRFNLNKAILKPMLFYASPLMFMGFAGMIDEMLSRKVLKYLLPDGYYPGITKVEALGIFGACYKLAIFMNIAVQAFRYAADPFFFSQSQSKNAPETYARVMKYFIIAGAFIFVAVAANLSIVKYFLQSEKYWLGISIVPILLLAYLFSGIYYNLSFWYKLTDKTQYGLYITLVGAAITIVFNFLLIPLLGFHGSAITTLLCYLTMTIISFVLGQKYYPVPYHLISAFGYILLATLLVTAALWYPFGQGTLMSFGWQFFLVIIYLFVVFLAERKNFNRKKPA